MLGFCEVTSQGDDVGLYLGICIRMVVVVGCQHFGFGGSSSSSKRVEECSCGSGVNGDVGGDLLIILP